MTGQNKKGPRVSITIGPYQFCFTTASQVLQKKLRRRYNTFLSKENPEQHIQVFTIKRSNTYGNEQVSFQRDKNNISVSRFDFEFSGTFNSGTLRIWNNMFSFDSFLRILVGSTALFQNRGVLLHAAAVKHNDRAYIFPGTSGSGKTTLASMHSQDKVLTDELALITENSGRSHAWGTPFWGEFKGGINAGNARVAFIGPISKGTKWKLSPIPSDRFMKTLLQTIMTFDDPVIAAQNAMDFCAKMIAELPHALVTSRKQSCFPIELYTLLANNNRRSRPWKKK
jgi:hypothetical protein